MWKRIVGAAAGLAVLFTAAGVQSQGMEDVKITASDLGKGIHMLTGRGGNIGLSAGPDGVFMVDDQFALLMPKIVDAVRHISKQPIQFVLKTHWHFDHTDGKKNLGEAGVAIVAHNNVRRLMSAEQFLKALWRKIPAAPKAALPVVTFSDGVTFHLNGETIKMLHTPNAHLSGDSIVHLVEADVIHKGDMFFNGFYPSIDFQHGALSRAW